MVNDRVLLGAVAFGVSFGLSFLTDRNLGKAFSAAVITVPATLIAAGVVEQRQRYDAKSTLALLNDEIQSLEEQEEDLEEDIFDLIEAKQALTVQLNAAQAQLQQTKLQVSDYWNHKEELIWKLNMLKTMELQLGEQVQQLQRQFQDLERQEAEAKRSLVTIDALKEQTEAKLTTWQTELTQLETQIGDRQQQKANLERSLVTLQQQTQQLETASLQLQQEVQRLEARQIELSQSLSVLQATHPPEQRQEHPLQVAVQQLQAQVNSLQVELVQLESQIIERRSEKDALEQELATLQLLKAQAATQNLHTPTPTTDPATPQQQRGIPPFKPATSPEALPSDWQAFLLQLPMPEFQVLKAIAEQANPNTTIKQVAEANLMMPELLIESLNECALDTIGDIVIDGSTPPAIASEYLALTQQLIKAYEDLQE